MCHGPGIRIAFGWYWVGLLVGVRSLDGMPHSDGTGWHRMAVGLTGVDGAGMGLDAVGLLLLLPVLLRFVCYFDEFHQNRCILSF